jgi:hypothetical protein
VAKAGEPMKHNCYSCGKPAIGLFNSMGMSHNMNLWLCADHINGATEVPPPCDNHVEKQHRDRKGPWCANCGWGYGKIIPPFKGKQVLDTTE